MDNGVGRGTRSPEQQASVLRAVGFQGISYNYTNPADLARWLTELKSRQLRLYGIYLGAKLDTEPAVPSDSVASGGPPARNRRRDLAHTAATRAARKLRRPGGATDSPSRPRRHSPGSASWCIRISVFMWPRRKKHSLWSVGVERANVGSHRQSRARTRRRNGSRLPEIIRHVRTAAPPGDQRCV